MNLKNKIVSDGIRKKKKHLSTVSKPKKNYMFSLQNTLRNIHWNSILLIYWKQKNNRSKAKAQKQRHHISIVGTLFQSEKSK